MIKITMIASILLATITSCNSTQSTSSSTSTTTEKVAKTDPNKIPGSTPITQPVEKNSAKSIIALPVE